MANSGKADAHQHGAASSDIRKPAPETKINRRSVIRKLTITTAALAGCSALPDRWTTPLVEFGSLPAHAATSGDIKSLLEEIQQELANVEANNIENAAAGGQSPETAAAPTAAPVDDMRGYSKKITSNNTGAKISIDKILRDKFVFPRLGPQYGPKMLVVWSDGRELYVPDATRMIMLGPPDERKYQPGGKYSGNNPDIPTMEVYAAIGTHPRSVTVYY